MLTHCDIIQADDTGPPGVFSKTLNGIERADQHDVVEFAWLLFHYLAVDTEVAVHIPQHLVVAIQASFGISEVRRQAFPVGRGLYIGKYGLRARGMDARALGAVEVVPKHFCTDIFKQKQANF